jgi:hypothetical protein
MPHQIDRRVDGWVIDPKHEDRIPAAVAEMIARAIPHHRSNALAAIYARMVARHKKVLGYV